MKFDGWPWNTTGYLFYATLNFENHSITIDKFDMELQSGNVQYGSKLAFFPCDLEIWRMALKINRAPLPCYFNRCASFFSATCEFKPELQSGKLPYWDKIYVDLCDLDLWPLTSTFCMHTTFVNGNYSWKFNDDTKEGTLLKCVPDERTDGRTDRTLYRTA